MDSEALQAKSLFYERAVTDKFLKAPDDESFTELFKVFYPQLVAFFRNRGRRAMAEDLAQDVMWTVYRKSGQLRDRASFRGWMFKIARHTLYRVYDEQAREVATVDLADVPDRFIAAPNSAAGSPAFEFHNWMGVLDDREREALTLRFVEELEYHEISTATEIPIGTIQWRVFSAKRKLAPYLKTGNRFMRKAA
jgi:RNA polymerase sigma-70 factor (ECF subfamily)